MWLLVLAVLAVLGLRKKPEEKKEDEEDVEIPEESAGAALAFRPPFDSYTGVETYEEITGRPGSPQFPGFIPPGTQPIGPNLDPVTPGGMNPGGIGAPQVGPGRQMTEDELHAAGAAYNSVVANAYPGVTQMWLNTQRMASWQHRALERNVSVASRAINFHKRLRKKIFG